MKNEFNENYSASYDVIRESNISAKERNHNWEIAIGLNEVDGLTPSDYLLELKEYSIDGTKNYAEIERALEKYYSNKDLKNTVVRQEFECDIVSTRIVGILEDASFVFSPIFLQDLHSRMFHGVFDACFERYVGKFRDYNITKNEAVLNGNTVTYGDHQKLMEYLQYDFAEEKKVDYFALSDEQQIQRIAAFTSSIWQIHPFVEGNTRTTALFIEKYLRSNGWNVDNTLFKDNSLYFRNALVLSNYTNMQERIKPSFKYLHSFFDKLIHENGQHLKTIETIKAHSFVEKSDSSQQVPQKPQPIPQTRTRERDDDWDLER